MKKIFVSMMLAVAMIAGGSVYAQTDGTTGATAQKENVEKGKSKKGSKGDRMKGKGERSRFNPFDGIQLTEDQQQKLQLLQQGLGPVQLDKEQQAKIPENKNLTDEQKKQLREERKAAMKQRKQNYLKGVKETLSPDQYIIFLENCYLYTPQDQGKGMRTGDKDKSNRADKSKNRKSGKGNRHVEKAKKV